MPPSGDTGRPVPAGCRARSAGRVGNVECGALLRIHATGGRGTAGHAVWHPTTNQLIEASGDAWRWLFWVRTGADGWLEPLPLESFGPLPAPTHLRPPVPDRPSPV